MTNARKGKIARLPVKIREEVNLRLLDGQPASKILPWLNGQEVVLRVLDEHFGEEPITPQNLSEWRQGGYKDWLSRRERVAQIGELAKYSSQLARADGGTMSDGAVAILGGRLLEALETAADPVGADSSPDEAGLDLEGLAKCLVKLRKSDLDARALDQRDRTLGHRERTVALAEQQFQLKTCELFVQWFANEQAKEIAASSREPTLKISQLRELMFGTAEDTDDGGTNEN